MEFIQSFFSGIGTEIVSFLIGSAMGGVAGYKIGVTNKNKQCQRARDNASQTQIGNINIHYGSDGDKND